MTNVDNILCADSTDRKTFVLKAIFENLKASFFWGKTYSDNTLLKTYQIKFLVHEIIFFSRK